MLVFSVLMAACGSREVLVPYRGDNPAGLNLAGTWEQVGDIAATERRIRDAIRRTDDISDRIVVPTRRAQARRISSDGRSDGGLAHLFFENGRVLRITQTPGALFVSFDRAVVEEYRYGEFRTVSVGQAEAQRVSGWSGDAYVIETLGRNGMKLTERLSLSADGAELRRKVTFRSRRDESVVVEQRFRRRN